MALTCPNCGAQFDVTLFQFGRGVRCDCGEVVSLERGHTLRLTRPERGSRRPPDGEPPVGDAGGEQSE